MTTHSLDQAIEFGNRLVVIQKGQVVYDCDKRVDSVPSKKELLELYTQTS